MKIIIPIYTALCISLPAPASGLLPAQEYKSQEIAGWAMSEKLDDVRAYWDGKRPISQQGHPSAPSADYTRNFSSYPIGGELYTPRGRFEQTSAAIRPDKSGWCGIKFHVFDVSKAAGNPYQRLAVLQSWLEAHPEALIAVIRQIPARDRTHVQISLKEIEAQGGEGVMLRNPNHPYAVGRSSQFLKLKNRHDAGCTVTQHYEDKGKDAGRLDAVSCKSQYGEFRIGSGFKDQDRDNPPPVGSTITYRYRGFTQKGAPRFATFVRIRQGSRQPHPIKVKTGAYPLILKIQVV